MNKLVCTLVVIGILGLVSVPFSVQAGDGIPPSEEAVCDVLFDATPGLFGLCNAYCEAQDCDSYADGDEPPSCSRLLINYDRRAGDSDPPMPCLAEPVCPCWGTDELEAVADGVNPLPGELATHIPWTCVLDGPSNSIAVDEAEYLVSDSNGARFLTFTVVDLTPGDDSDEGSCSYSNGGMSPPIPTSTEENDFCRLQVLELLSRDFSGVVFCNNG